MTSDSKYTVGKYLATRLRELGLEHLFSIAGDYSIDWLNDYIEPAESGITIIEEVNETVAGYAADGYARLKGIGALCVTYSAGSLSAVNAIAGAYVERVPVVLINGTPSIGKTLEFEQTGLSPHHFITARDTGLRVFEAITVAAERIDNPDLAPTLIDYALKQCVTERRPIYLELLQEVVGQECARPQGPLTPARRPTDAGALQSAIDEINKKLAAAKNPLLWVGVEVDRFGLHESTEAMVRQLGIPFVTELMSKAVLSEDDPLFAGVFDGHASTQAVQDLVQNADFILALGVWLTDINSIAWPVNFDKIAFASQDVVKHDDFFKAPISLAEFITGLSAAGLAHKASGCLPTPNAPAVVFRPEEEITYQGFYDFIPQYIDTNTIIGADSSLNYFGCLSLKVSTPRGFVVQASYSSIGYAAPAATGVCLARPGQRVMVFTGDGGFQMTVQCLSTQTRFGLRPIIFVMDNGVFGVEQWLADASVFVEKKKFFRSCDLHRWDYSKLADVIGCQGFKAKTYGELKAAIGAAFANTNTPSLIQVVVPSWSIPTNAEFKKH